MAVKVHNEKKLQSKIFCVKKGGGADAFENDPPFRIKPTVEVYACCRIGEL